MNPTNPLPFFDRTRPVFIKQAEVQLSGKVRKRGEHFDWEAFGVPYHTMLMLFNQDFVYHDESLEEEKFHEVAAKDLEEMNIAELHIYIDRINVRVKPKFKNDKDYNTKKCPKVAKDCEMQVRKIKNWKLTYGHLLD
jgi:hypothetical protein